MIRSTKVRKFRLLAIALVVVTAAAPHALGATGRSTREKPLPLAFVAEDTISIADLDAEISASLAAAQGKLDLKGLDPEAVLRRLVQNRLLEQEGYRIGADQQSQVKGQVREFVRLRSVKALMDSVSAPRPGEGPADADTLIGMTSTMRRYSHILVPEQALARTLRDSLSHGVAFADLARRHSTDGNAANGGDLGWSGEGAYVDEFEKAARRLSLHEIAGPIKTKFGWHLITLTEVKSDTLKSQAMAQAMLDSKETQRRMALVRKYLDSLRKKYRVTVNDTLVRSLDYASKDPAVEKKLQSSDAVLATVPTGNLTVRALTRNIRFQYFHGLGDRPDAGAIRDKIFDEWVTESLLSHEAHILGMDHRHGIPEQAGREERRLVREEVLKSIVTFEYKPEDKAIRAYYQAHLTEFTPDPRIKLRSARFASEDAARKFYDQIKAGASFKWLVGRTPELDGTEPPFPTDWLEPKGIELGGLPLDEGTVLGPKALPGGWAVMEIAAVEKVRPTALKDCEAKVEATMRNERTREAIQEAVSRLESSTKITFSNGAKDAIKTRIESWRAASGEGGRS